METSLHRELKRRYAGDAAQVEVRLGRYIIDAVKRRELIEIQHGSLAAIRDKIRNLTAEHRVRVVKPLIARKTLCSLAHPQAVPHTRRLSPKRQSWIDLFAELVHFTRAFPHPNLTLEVPLIEIEEHRYPGHGRRRRYRDSDFIIEDQYLVAVLDTRVIRSLADLRKLFRPAIDQLPREFTTADLSRVLGVRRSQAQQLAYVLRECGAVRRTGVRDRAHLYRWEALGRRRAG